jgi:hypothetical protein
MKGRLGVPCLGATSVRRARDKGQAGPSCGDKGRWLPGTNNRKGDGGRPTDEANSSSDPIVALL